MGKTVLLTGVSGGIGLAVAKHLVSLGYQVFGLDIKAPKEELPGLTFIQADLTKEEEVVKAFEEAKKSDIKLSAIVSAAGMYELGSLVEMSEEEILRVFNVNVFSMIRVNRIFLPLLEEKGKIIMVSSELAPLDPLPFTGIYGISKSLVEKYADSLRMELQLLGHSVIVIRPGAIDTGLIGVSQRKLDDFVAKTEHFQTNSQRFKQIVDLVESKKIPPEKLAKLIGKVLQKKKPKYVYKINRNRGLLFLNALPKRTQNWIIKKILTDKEND